MVAAADLVAEPIDHTMRLLDSFKRIRDADMSKRDTADQDKADAATIGGKGTLEARIEKLEAFAKAVRAMARNMGLQIPELD